MTDPGTNRNPWTLWLTNAGAAAVWGGFCNLLALAISGIVASVGVPGAFWGGKVGQDAIVLVIFLVVTGACAVALTTKHFKPVQPLKFQFFISITNLSFCVLGFICVYLILSVIFEVSLNDYVFNLAMTFTFLPSLFVVHELSERLLNDHHPAG